MLHPSLLLKWPLTHHLLFLISISIPLKDCLLLEPSLMFCSPTMGEVRDSNFWLHLRIILVAFDINVAPPALLWLLCAWYIFFHASTLNLFVSLNLSYVSGRRCIVESYFSKSNHVCLLIWVFFHSHLMKLLLWVDLFFHLMWWISLPVDFIS